MIDQKFKIGYLTIFFEALTVGIAFAQEDIRDVKGPIEVPINVKMWIIIGIMVCFIGIGIAVYFLFKNHKKKEKVSVLPDPWEVAYGDLENLNKTDLIEKSLFKEYFSRLSDIMRKYFEAHLTIKAPEMTTEEFLISLRSSRKLKEDQKGSLKEFLIRCDLVKFAKFPTTSIEADQGFQLVKSLIDDTKPKAMVAK